ncbi:MAG: LamG-like jellyroll fold domain-containing protein, partial [Bacteroidota bacterium]
YISVEDSADINLGIHPKRTVTAWFKVDNKTPFLPNASDERKQVIYEEGGYGAGLNIYIENGSLYVGGWNESVSNWSGTYLSTDVIESNTWHHVALVLDAEPGSTEVQSNVFSGYLDGVKFGEGEGSELRQHPGNIALGAIDVDTQFHDGDVLGTGIEVLGGSLGEVQIFNEVLSEADIAFEVGLVAQWDFDETSGTVTADSSPAGTSNEGALINEASFEETGSALRGSVHFLNQDDYVAVEDSEDINLVPHAKRTISTWFKADNISSVSDRKQVIYEEGGFGNGLNIYLDDSRLYFGGWSGESWSSGTYLSTDAIQSDEWHHVVLVLDAEENITSLQSGAFSAYLDGVKIDEGDGREVARHPGNIALGAIDVDTQFHDGDVLGTAIDGLIGNIADAKIFNRALSAEEVQTLYTDKLALVTETIVSGLAQPQAIEWIPNTSNFFIVEKSGVVKTYKDGNLLSTPFIDISGEVNNDKFTTRGITDIAVHPDFEQNPYVYLFFAYDPPFVYDNLDDPFAGPDQSGVRGARVIRVRADASTDFTTAIPGSEVVLVGANSTWDNYDGSVNPFGSDSAIRNNPSGILPDGTNIPDFIAVESNFHNTGSLEFGPDGALYVSIGDGTTARLDTGAFRSQDRDNLSGNILRIDPLTGEGLSDNPFFVNSDPNSNISKTYQYGLRNPFRIS